MIINLGVDSPIGHSKNKKTEGVLPQGRTAQDKPTEKVIEAYEHRQKRKSYEILHFKGKRSD